MKYSSRKRNLSKGKRTYKRKAVRKPAKLSLVKTIQSVINKNAENKICFGSLQNSYYNSGINSAADCVTCIPNLGIGSADNQRIGDQTRVQSHVVQGCLQLATPSTNISNTRIAVRLMIVQPKQFGNMADAIAAGAVWTSYLLKKGGTTSAFTGQLNDLWAKINTDAITKYYDKVFYMNTAYSQGTGNGISQIGDSIKFFKVNLTRRNKLLKFDSGIDSGLTPTNYAPIILLGYVKLDGAAPDTVSTIVSLSFDTNLMFQDT